MHFAHWADVLCKACNGFLFHSKLRNAHFCIRKQLNETHNDSTREGTGNGGSGEVLPAEGTADGAGSEIGNQRGAEADAGREGAAATGAVPEGAPAGGVGARVGAQGNAVDENGELIAEKVDGITDYTIDQNAKTIILDVFGLEEEAVQQFSTQYYNLKKQLQKDGNFDGRTKEKVPKESRLVTAEDRRRRYEAWLASNKAGGKDRGTRRAVREALERLNDSEWWREANQRYESPGVQGEGHEDADGDLRLQQGGGGSSSEQSVLESSKERHDGDTQEFFEKTVNGEEIRKAGYVSVLDFIEEVAQNYETIKEGNVRDGNQTYMLQLKDKHNNTLMVELSGDGNYWNINTAGIFKTSYGANRREVYNRHTTAKQSAETAEASLSGEQSGTTPSTSMNAPTSSAGKDNASSANEQGNGGKNADGYDVTLQQINDYINDVTPNNPYGRRLSQRLPQRVGRAVERKKGIAAVDALLSRASESAIRPNERTRAEGRRKIEEGKKKGLEQRHIVQPLRNAQEGGYKPLDCKSIRLITRIILRANNMWVQYGLTGIIKGYK